jgi:hypothetical protein
MPFSSKESVDDSDGTRTGVFGRGASWCEAPSFTAVNSSSAKAQAEDCSKQPDGPTESEGARATASSVRQISVSMVSLAVVFVSIMIVSNTTVQLVFKVSSGLFLKFESFQVFLVSVLYDLVWRFVLSVGVLEISGRLTSGVKFRMQPVP